MMKRLVWAFIIVFMLLFTGTGRAEAAQQGDSGWEDGLSSYDFSEMEQVLQEALGGEKISFSQVVRQLADGNYAEFLQLLLRYADDVILREMRLGRSAAWQIVLLAMAGAVLTNLAKTFSDSTVSETGFSAIYMVLAALLLTVFAASVSVASEGLLVVGRLMTAFLPVFFLAVAVQGQLTAAAMYEFSLVLIRGIQWFYENIVVGGVKIWVVLRIVEGVLPEELLTRLTSLIGKLLKGAIKTAFGAALGFQTVQALLLPYMDAVKGGTLMKLAGAVPGIGNSVEAAAQVALGTAALLRNGIGMAGMLVLLLASLGPLVKLGFLALLYHGLAAVLQPVSDKRLLEAVAAVGDGSLLLLKTLGAGILLFGIAIGIACACFGRVS